MEKIDLYNKERIKTGKIIERGTPIPEGYYRTVVHMCLFNSKNQMLIQKRTARKKWPSKWDITVGGGVTSGEASNVAMQRETKEELGLSIDFTNIRPIFTFNFDNGFDDIYLINKDVDISSLVLQKEEVEDVMWATEDEIIKMIKDHTFIIYDEHFIRMLFSIRNNQDIYKE